MRRVIILFCLLILVAKVYGQNTRIYFTKSGDILSDVTICYSNSPLDFSALEVYVDDESSYNNDLNICFVDKSTYSSIDVDVVNSSKDADIKICLTTNSLYAKKTIRITNTSYKADIRIRFYDTPTSSTRNIYIKGINPMVLSVEAKLSILYVLGLLKK